MEAVRKWEATGPEEVKKDIQMFLGFTNYYRHFVNKYSEIARPLSYLTGDVPWTWGSEQEKAFEVFRTALITAPLLQHFDRDLPT